MDKDKIADIIACAIADGKFTVEYVATAFAIANLVGSLTDLAEVCEEVADIAQDAGIAIREMALAIEALGVEDLDNGSEKD